jgi:nucleotide-binding universal stress UspA family protein
MKTVEAGKRITLNNILFATDFSIHSNAALPFALAIAHQYGAKIYGAHVMASAGYLLTAPDLWPAHIQQEKQLEDSVKGRLDEQLRGVQHETLVGVGDVWNTLSRLISKHDIDLLVVGTHGRTGAQKLLMGSIAETIFRQAYCPVLSIGPNVSCRPSDEIQFHNILLATDLGEESLASLRYAFSLAEEAQATLTLLHVVEQPAVGIIDLEAVTACVMSQLKQLVPPDAEAWCRVECLVEFGQQFALPAQRILDIARDKAADLIVLGVHPTSRAMSTVTHLAQTTAQHVVAHATCPVLTIRC